jgi:hypothetical protein
MKKVLLVAHCVELLALSAWVGGLMIIMAAVIPAVFNTIAMESGGRLLTRVFQGYDRIVLFAAGLIVIGTLTRVRAARLWRTQIGTAELMLFGIMLALAVYLALAWNPHMMMLQEKAFGAQDAVVRQMALQDFFLGHQIARTLYLLNFGLGIALMCVKVRKWTR